MSNPDELENSFNAMEPSDKSVSFRPDEEYSIEQPTETYPTMEELQPRSPQQFPMASPPDQSIAQMISLEEAEEVEESRALVIKFAIGKLIDYLFWFLMLLELISLTRLLLKLIGSNPSNPFAGFLYGLSDILLFPFLSIVPSIEIHPLNQPLEISTLVGMFVYFLVFFLIARFLKLLVSNPKSAEEELDLRLPKASREKFFASKFAITQVRSFYQNARRQFKSWLYFSVIAVILGTLCIACLYILPYFGKVLSISNNIASVLTVVIAAVFLYIIAIFSFLQNRAAYKQVDSYYSDKLIEAEKISHLTTLASNTPISEAQEHINETILTRILAPMEKGKIGKENPKLKSDEILEKRFNDL